MEVENVRDVEHDVLAGVSAPAAHRAYAGVILDDAVRSDTYAPMSSVVASSLGGQAADAAKGLAQTEDRDHA